MKEYRVSGFSRFIPTAKDLIVIRKYNFIVIPEKFQFLEKWQNRNFDYKIVISVKNPEFIL